MTKWYFVKNWERTGHGYTPAELAEMLLQKKIRRNRNVLSDDDTGSDVGGVIAEAYCELWDNCLSVRQRAYLRFLGYRGTLYLPQNVGSELIEKIRETQEYEDRDEKGFNKYIVAAEKEDGEYVAEVLRRHYHVVPFTPGLANRGELKHLIAGTQQSEVLQQYGDQAQKIAEKKALIFVKQQNELLRAQEKAEVIVGCVGVAMLIGLLWGLGIIIQGIIAEIKSCIAGCLTCGGCFTVAAAGMAYPCYCAVWWLVENAPRLLSLFSLA